MGALVVVTGLAACAVGMAIATLVHRFHARRKCAAMQQQVDAMLATCESARRS